MKEIKIQIIERPLINKLILADFFVYGKTEKDLSLKYCYSEKSIKQIIEGK